MLTVKLASGAIVATSLKGAGAFLPRMSYCDSLTMRYKLEKLVVGYQLSSK